MLKSRRIWFITGISSGLGQALAQAAMASGDFVIGTFRGGDQATAFNEVHVGRGHAIVLDVAHTHTIQPAITAVLAQYPHVDVVVNNAGFGFAGAIEEASDTETRAVFEANFFGALAITRAFLPTLRMQRSGHIVQISSHGGFKAFAGFGIYNASKFALEGMSEALAAELAPLGIRLTLVEPGPFRTQFAGPGFQQAARQIADYDNTAGAFRARMQAVAGKQEGDPAKAAQAIIQLVNSDNPPLRLPLGKVALATLAAKLESVRADMEAGRAIAEAAVYE